MIDLGRLTEGNMFRLQLTSETVYTDKSKQFILKTSYNYKCQNSFNQYPSLCNHNNKKLTNHVADGHTERQSADGQWSIYVAQGPRGGGGWYTVCAGLAILRRPTVAKR